MFYIQTQDGDLPYKYKVYATQKGAEKAAHKFMAENHQAGAFAVCDAFHRGLKYLFRDDAGEAYVEEIINDDGEVVKTTYH